MGSFAFEPVGIDAPKGVSPYELRALVATGARGRTYLAFTADGRAAAVKVFRFGIGSDPMPRARFLRAATVARSMHCAFAAPVLGAGFTMHRLWLATAYLPGPSLADAIFQYGALPREGVRRLALALIELVGELHLVGLSGRGLAPSDVVLTADGPRVVDLGFVRVEIEGGGGEGAVSPAPQDEIPGRYTSGASVLAQDVRDVAEILYFAATGRTLFGDPGDILRPNVGNCPQALRELIAAGLRENPANRPTLSELAAAASTAGVPASTAANWATADWLPNGALQDARERASVVASIHRQHAWVAAGMLPEAEVHTGSRTPGLDRGPEQIEDRRPSEERLTAVDVSKSLARKVWRRMK